MRAINDAALRSSAKNGHLHIVKALINNGMDIHTDDACIAFTESVSYNRTAIIKYFLHQGADVQIATTIAQEEHAPTLLAWLKEYQCMQQQKILLAGIPTLSPKNQNRI